MSIFRLFILSLSGKHRKMKADLKKIERISKALGDPYRLQILEAISVEQNWMPCSMLVEKFNLAQSTVSHHMKQLTDAEIVLVEKDGRATKYIVNRDVMNSYTEYLNSL